MSIALDEGFADKIVDFFKKDKEPAWRVTEEVVEKALELLEPVVGQVVRDAFQDYDVDVKRVEAEVAGRAVIGAHFEVSLKALRDPKLPPEDITALTLYIFPRFKDNEPGVIYSRVNIKLTLAKEVRVNTSKFKRLERSLRGLTSDIDMHVYDSGRTLMIYSYMPRGKNALRAYLKVMKPNLSDLIERGPDETPRLAESLEIDAGRFERSTGRPPEQDDLDRCNCYKAGSPGHRSCGWCPEHDLPRFECGCILGGPPVGLVELEEAIVAKLTRRDHE